MPQTPVRRHAGALQGRPHAQTPWLSLVACRVRCAWSSYALTVPGVLKTPTVTQHPRLAQTTPVVGHAQAPVLLIEFGQVGEQGGHLQFSDGKRLLKQWLGQGVYEACSLR